MEKRKNQSSLANEETAIQREISRLEQVQEENRQLFKDFKSTYSIVNISDAGLRATQQREHCQDELAKYKTEIEILRYATTSDVASGVVSVRDNPADSKGNRTSRASRDDKPSRDDISNSDEDTTERYSAGWNYTQLRSKLKDYEIEYTNRLQTLKINHPHMREVSRNIALCQSSILSSLSLIKEAVDARIKAIEHKAAALPAAIEKLEQEIRDQGATKLEYEQMEAGIRLNDEQIKILKERLPGMKKWFLAISSVTGGA